MSKRLYSGRYEVQEFIADGEMGAMHKAWDNTSFDHIVALQVIHSHLSSDATFIQRFRDAARKTAQLQPHPNIIQIVDVQHDHGIDYLVMEYFPSTNLRDHIQSHGKFSIRDATDIIRQIGEALSHTHASGLLHRDIKPANILIDEKQHVKLTDFGIAKAMSDAPLTATGQLLGTLKYMAPEQAAHLPLDGKTDLYSLGMVFYELVTGKNLWNAVPNLTIYSHLQDEQTVPPLNFPPDVPQDIQEVIKELLRFDPTKRMPNAQSLVMRLENLKSILDDRPAGEHEEDPDATIAIPRKDLPEALKDHTTEVIQQTPSPPLPTPEPSVPPKTSVKKQPPQHQASDQNPIEDDPAAKAKDPAKPYYFVDDSQSFTKHREEAEAKTALFLDQFPAPNSHSSPSFFTVKKMMAVAFLLLVGATAYWNQEFLMPSQETLVIQETESGEIQERNTQNVVETQTADLSLQEKTIPLPQPTEIVQPTIAVPDAQTTDVFQQDRAVAEAEAAERARQVQATIDAQAAERARQTKATADAEAAERARQVQATVDAQATERARQAKATADAQAAERARQTKATADAQAAERARQAKATADAQAAKREQQEKKSAVQTSKRATEPQATTARKSAPDTQAAQLPQPDQATEDTQATKAQDEVLYQQARAATEARAAELTRQAQARANAQAAEPAQQAQAATADSQALLRLLEQLRGSVAKKDLPALTRLSTMSESRYRMLKDLFSRYRTVEISIGDVRRTLDKATATFQITKLIRPNGVIVRPHPIVQNIKVTVLKHKEDWNLPAW